MQHALFTALTHAIYATGALLGGAVVGKIIVVLL
jgi:hypothetical protein